MATSCDWNVSVKHSDSNGLELIFNINLASGSRIKIRPLGTPQVLGETKLPELVAPHATLRNDTSEHVDLLVGNDRLMVEACIRPQLRVQVELLVAVRSLILACFVG